VLLSEFRPEGVRSGQFTAEIKDADRDGQSEILVSTAGDEESVAVYDHEGRGLGLIGPTDGTVFQVAASGLALGSASGGSPQARTFRSLGSVSGFFAYEPSFRGGIRAVTVGLRH
jgi:hypothetical protein